MIPSHFLSSRISRCTKSKLAQLPKLKSNNWASKTSSTSRKFYHSNTPISHVDPNIYGLPGYMASHEPNTIYGTTILSIRKNGKVVMIGDGQMSLGPTVVKGKAVKIRRLHNILIGCAGSTADAFALIEGFEKHLGEHSGDMKKAAVSLAKQWRTDRSMARLNAVLCLSDIHSTLLFDGQGNVIQPDDERLLSIGSGSNFAISAARALLDNTDLPAEEVAEKSMHIAADLCVYTNHNFTMMSLDESNLIRTPFEPEL